MEKNKGILGILLIGLGTILLCSNLFGFRFGNIAIHWPLLIIALGAVFEWLYLSDKKNPGLLVPGGILLVLGFLFEFEMLTDWRFSEYTWPIYLLAVAFGLFQLYLASDRRRGLLVPVGVLSGIALLSYLAYIFKAISAAINFGILVPLILIVLGLLLIFRK
ncbi:MULTISPECIES: hypothetical protein [Desulfitobacterium]|uniref:DUF5668 domain-containing protein n=1 Tax=Desulfitobacterium dehalogenans (strain ATCC 51507 / DSM 9161 / JW/IU-DC1) TaxID=756499 RepID=I4A6U8_DESDJ|nr:MULTISPECIES: hypothetical protein [Desulfitobacterium]AFL99682.1 hypothetical protein Desde_1253 [Desulfitobacterium dehalogenans ATCC 51507]